MDPKRTSASRWQGLSDRAQVALLGRLFEALSSDFPGGVRARVDRGRGWGIVELTGTGKRRLPGMRRDLREHVLRAAYDGRFLAASLEIAGTLVDTVSLPAPSAAEVGEVVAFFRRHAPRIWWKGSPQRAAPAPRDGGAKRAPRARAAGGGAAAAAKRSRAARRGSGRA